MSIEWRGNQLYLDGRHIGWVTKTMDKKRIYVSPRNRSGIRKDSKGHYFELFRGYGLAKSVLEFLKLNNFDEIHLRIGLREILISTPEQWEEYGIPYKHADWESQIILPEKYMRRIFLTLADITL